MKKQNDNDQHRFTRGEPYNQQKVNRRTFLSFLTFGVTSIAAFFGWKWLYEQPLESKGITAGTRRTLRSVLNTNENIFNKTLPAQHLAKTYPISAAAKQPRVNGDIGLEETVDKDWQLTIVKSATKSLYLKLDELKALPKTELVIDFKCVEGWEQVMHWGGVKFGDFINHLKLNKQAQMQYCGFQTPDKKYYVGIDMASMMHSQTILAYEMNGKLLSPEHGAPLRLIIPVKYGIKNLKRIGTLFFSDQRPADYWAENGYDYYSGL